MLWAKPFEGTEEGVVKVLELQHWLRRRFRIFAALWHRAGRQAEAAWVVQIRDVVKPAS